MHITLLSPDHKNSMQNNVINSYHRTPKNHKPSDPNNKCSNRNMRSYHKNMTSFIKSINKYAQLEKQVQKDHS